MLPAGRPCLFQAALLVTGLALAACGQQASGPEPAQPVGDQLARGAPIYAQSCATAQCHGTDGEGLRDGERFRVWPLVGSEFQARNPSAQVVYDIARSGPEQELRALTDQEIYDAVAYELSLNGASPNGTLTAGNAAGTPSGAGVALPAPGTLYPPANNATLLAGGGLALPAEAESGGVALRVTQAAAAGQIAGQSAPGGGHYLVLVFSLDTLAAGPLEVSPAGLRLLTAAGDELSPVNLRLDYPVAAFRQQTIEPTHGTSGHAVFALAAGDEPVALRYEAVMVPLAAPAPNHG